MNTQPTSKAFVLPLLLLAVSLALVVTAVTLSVVRDGGERWAQITAAAGLIATVAAAGVLLGTAQGWVNGRRLSLAAVSTAVMGLGSLALVIVTYVGATGDVAEQVATTGSAGTGEGIALTEQVSNNDVQPPGYAHDVGDHPTIGQFLEMDNTSVLSSVPGGTLLPDEVDALRDELAATRGFAEQHNTVEKARAAGYYNTTNDVPFMGAHFINNEYLTDGVFDAGKPEGLLFSKKGNPDAEWQLVGVWYLIIPGMNPGVTDETPPEGFSGNLDLWHAHYGLCTRDGVISENNTFESCAEDGGSWTGDLRWMMHVWAYPEGAENPEGVFVYLNQLLWESQRLAEAPILR